MLAGVVFLLSLLVTVHGINSASDLVGTWSTKSRSVATGPVCIYFQDRGEVLEKLTDQGFFDPVEDRLIEPKHTGISYSFTADGYYEVAYYRSLSNPKDPSCPKAIMQWQHGAYTLFVNGSLSLTPIAVDGRQLLSDPCKHAVGTYTRYNQTEFFKKFSVYTDPYHDKRRLDLYGFDGAPLHPMYLAYNPPEMLPSDTLNPFHAQGSESTKDKRQVGDEAGGASYYMQALMQREGLVNPDRWWWVGVVATSLGGFVMMYS